MQRESRSAPPPGRRARDLRGGTLPPAASRAQRLVPSAAVRPAVDIPAPPFPAGLTWVNVASLRMDKQRGRPVLVEFFDVCAPSSLRSLPYLQAWHARYADAGLRVVSVHTPGFAPGRDPERRAGRRRAARGRAPGRPGPRLPALGPLRDRGLARRATSSTPTSGWPRPTSARAATPRPSARSRSCSASTATSSARCGPRTRRTRCIVVPTARPRGPPRRALRGRGGVGGRRGRGRAARRRPHAWPSPARARVVRRRARALHRRDAARSRPGPA